MSYNELSDDYEKAKAYALNLLSRRDYSGAELKAKLGKYYDEETCAAVLRRAREIGFQDDMAYAEKLAAHLIEGKHYGIRRARYEMRLKGLDDETAQAALSLYDEEDVTLKLVELIRSKYSRLLCEPCDYKDKKKVADALARRGYEYDDIKAAIQKVYEEVCDE